MKKPDVSPLNCRPLSVNANSCNGENCGKYFEIHLEPQERDNPLLAVADFFSDDWLPSQIKRLEIWRDQVLSEEYYKGLKDSPAELLYFHKHNINLIEACYLLYLKHFPINIVKSVYDLKREESIWLNFPDNLKESELLDPFLVVNQFFKDYTLPDYRSMLYEWLEYGLSSRAADEFIAAKDLISVYENLQKLYSVAWLIHQRSSERPYLKTNQTKMEVETNVSELDAAKEDGSIYDLCADIQPHRQDMLKNLTGIIKHKVPSTQAIIYLGAVPNQPDRIFLLVLTANTETNQASALSSTIEESCKDVASLTALVHYASALTTAVNENNPFFCRALNSPVIYLSGDLLLPVAKPIHLFLNNDTELNWKHWQTQGHEFLKGTEFYLENNAAGPALFSLHQCTESLLLAILRGVLGYRINNHNLSRLLNLSQMFTNAIGAVFDFNVPKNKELFDLLKNAYVGVRYRDTFEPDIKHVKALYQVIKQCVYVTEKVYQRYLIGATL